MGEKKRVPVTQEHLRIEPPKRKGIPDSTQPMRQTPPPLPKINPPNHAAREVLEEAPTTLDPMIAKTLEPGVAIRTDSVTGAVTLEKLEETPITLDPLIAKTLEPGIGIKIVPGTGQVTIERLKQQQGIKRGREIDAQVACGVLRSAKCLNLPGFDPADFASRIKRMYDCNESENGCGAEYKLIEMEDGQLFRLYGQYANLASDQKFEKCRGLDARGKQPALLDMDGQLYSLYWETPVLKQR